MAGGEERKKGALAPVSGWGATAAETQVASSRFPLAERLLALSWISDPGEPRLSLAGQQLKVMGFWLLLALQKPGFKLPGVGCCVLCMCDVPLLSLQSAQWHWGSWCGPGAWAALRARLGSPAPKTIRDHRQEIQLLICSSAFVQRVTASLSAHNAGSASMDAVQATSLVFTPPKHLWSCPKNPGGQTHSCPAVP